MALKEYKSGGVGWMIWIDGNHVVKWECKKDYKAVFDNIEANVSQALSLPDALKQSHILSVLPKHIPEERLSRWL